jgi:hypothetical protein
MDLQIQALHLYASEHASARGKSVRLEIMVTHSHTAMVHLVSPTHTPQGWDVPFEFLNGKTAAIFGMEPPF